MDDNMKDFINKMSMLSDKDYLFNFMVYNIAPCLYGSKCAALLRLSKSNKNNYEIWRTYKRELIDSIPLKYFELSCTKDVYSILFYNEVILNRLISQKKNIDFLKDIGYGEYENTTDYLYKLRERYRANCPDEIGLFLGIPLHDVLGFIKNCGKGYLYCGYWKVYDELDKALKIFNDYDKAKDRIIKLIGQGGKYIDIIR